MIDHILAELERLIQRIDPTLDRSTLTYSLETGPDRVVHLWHCSPERFSIASFTHDSLRTATWCTHDLGDPAARARDLISRTTHHDLAAATQSLSILDNIVVPDAAEHRQAVLTPHDAVNLMYRVMLYIGRFKQDISFATVASAGEYQHLVTEAAETLRHAHHAYLRDTIEHPSIRAMLRTAATQHGSTEIENEVTVALNNIGTRYGRTENNALGANVYGAALISWAVNAVEEPCVVTMPQWLYDATRSLDAEQPSGPYADPVPMIASQPYLGLEQRVLETAKALWRPGSWESSEVYRSFDACVRAATALL